MALVQQNEPREPQSQFNGGRILQPSPTTTTTTVEEDKMNSNSLSKRQRRPSVRLNEIGDQPAAAAALTKHSKSPLFNTNRPSKTRPLTNLPVDNLAIATWKLKPAAAAGGGSKVKRESKRPRTNWASKEVDDEPGPVNEDGFSKDFELEGSQSPFKHMPNPNPNPNPARHDDDGDVRDLQFRAPRNDDDDDDDDDDNDDDGNVRDLQFRAHQSVRARNENDDGVDLDGPSDDSGRRLGKQDDDGDGVRVWLDRLGLGRYWLLFKIHEVDEEVLPFLTLEDLKDMGISAVGSRRKLYCAIKKLNNDNDNDDGFS